MTTDTDNPVLKFADSEEAASHMRFCRLDDQRFDSKINFISAFNQNCRVVTSEESRHQIHTHDDRVLQSSIIELMNDIDIELPMDFYDHTQIWNVPGLLFSRGIQVDTRVLRQQVFLGGANYPISTDKTHKILAHGIGTAVWNFMISRMWNWDLGKQNRYRELRRIPYIPRNQSSEKNRPKYQSNLFYVAAEDFRYLFGNMNSGRDEWYLQDISAPGDMVEAFWREELEPRGYNEEEEVAEAAVEDLAE